MTPEIKPDNNIIATIDRTSHFQINISRRGRSKTKHINSKSGMEINRKYFYIKLENKVSMDCVQMSFKQVHYFILKKWEKFCLISFYPKRHCSCLAFEKYGSLSSYLANM